MEKNSNERQRAISSRTSISINVGLVAGIVVGAWVFLYAELHILENEIEARCSRFNERLESKADKSQASDRYTGATHEQYANGVTQRFTDAEKVDARTVEGLQKQIDNLHLYILKIETGK